MTVKLFQDVAGTIPAVLAGQPVGFIKRTKGSDDAKQATALSKPTLVRHPKTGVRNLAMGAQAVGVAAYWPETSLGGGITSTKVGSGVEADGVPYIDVRYTGTAVTSSMSSTYNQTHSRVPSELGSAFTCSCSAKIIDGSLPSSPTGSRGIAAVVNELTSGGVYVAGSSSAARANTADYAEVVVTRVASAGTAQIIHGLPQLAFVAGDILDVTFRIKGFMFERGPAQTPFQFNYGPNDITEPGVPDLWHLYNDGGDSLNVTLPAGTYGLASIGIDRQIDIGTFVSDGTTPVNILRHERQLDVSYRLGAYSAAEEVAIRDTWGRKYA